jgi:choice-of-anchor A domain-containing protein
MLDRSKGRAWRSGLSGLFAVGAVIVTLWSAASARAGSISWQQFDVVTLGNFSSPSDVEGSALIGGNVTGTTWNVSTNQTISSAIPTPIVGGTFSGTVQIEHGSLFISNAGDITHGAIVNYNGGGGPIYDNSPGVTTSVATEIATVTSQLQSATAGYAALTANNTVQINGSTAIFNATSVNANGVAVFVRRLRASRGRAGTIVDRDAVGIDDFRVGILVQTSSRGESTG